MQYTDLATWVLGGMRMSEVYQPSAIICLIYRGGTATLQQIHDHLEMRRRERDPTIEERALSDTRQMPCDVLVNNNIIREISKHTYEFRDFESYTPQQLTAIV